MKQILFELIHTSSHNTKKWNQQNSIADTFSERQRFKNE